MTSISCGLNPFEFGFQIQDVELLLVIKGDKNAM